MIEIKHKVTGKVLHTVNADTLERADLRGVDLSHADLSRLNLCGSNLSGANLFLAKITDSDLSGASLVGAFLSDAELQRANLSKAELAAADVAGADLSNSNLSNTDMRADLRKAVMTSAIAVGANFMNSNLEGTELCDADFTRATFGFTKITFCKTLHLARGLAAIEHRAPSALDARTLRACISNLPDVFLEGCGYNREEIEYLRAMYADKAFRYYSCFLSHASDDAEFADRLHADLRANNVTCWYSRHDMKGGEDWMPQINAAIKSHEKLVLITSRRSIYRPVVVKEILAAIDQERKEGVQKLFPLRMDDHILSDEMAEEAIHKVKTGEWREDWVYYVRKKHIPDFSKWQDHASYKKELDNLLRDLKAAPMT